MFRKLMEIMSDDLQLELNTEGTGWNPPRPGSPERDKWPSHVFMLPDAKPHPLFPYKEYIDGHWQVTARALRAVISRANTTGHQDVQRRASEMLRKYHEQNSTEENMEINEIAKLRYDIASEVYKNEMSENDALRGYAALLEDMTELYMGVSNEELKAVLDKGINDVREIMGDEKNHKLVLQALTNNLDMVLIAYDGMTEALANIVAHVESDSGS